MSSPDFFDLTILGGGPAGLFAAYYAGLRGMRTKIIDSLPELGGQLTALYPEKRIFDIPGFPEIRARDLAKNLIVQAMQSEPTVCLNEIVRALEPAIHPSGATPAYALNSDRAAHHTRTVLIAAGAGAFTPRKLPLAEAAPLEGHSVFYSVAAKSTFAGKNLLIIGGGDSAIDWALNLLDTAGAITLIHRRDTFRAHEESVRRLQASRATILPFHELEALITADGALTAVLQNNREHSTRSLPVDAILVQIGFLSSLGPIQQWPLKIHRGAIPVSPRMETALPGIFAAGDLAAYEGKLKLIANAFAEAATAVNYAKTRIDPEARAFPGHSSELTAQPDTMTSL